MRDEHKSIHNMGSFYPPSTNPGVNNVTVYYLSPSPDFGPYSVTWAPKPRINLVYTFYPVVDFLQDSLIFMIQILHNQLENAYALGIDKDSQLKKEVKRNAPLLKEYLVNS